MVEKLVQYKRCAWNLITIRYKYIIIFEIRREILYSWNSDRLKFASKCSIFQKDEHSLLTTSVSGNVWVRGHSKIAENWKADELAIDGTLVQFTSDWERSVYPLHTTTSFCAAVRSFWLTLEYIRWTELILAWKRRSQLSVIHL